MPPAEKLPVANESSDKDNLLSTIEIRAEDSSELQRVHKVGLDGKKREIEIDFRDGSKGIKHLNPDGTVKALEINIKEPKYQIQVKAKIDDKGELGDVSIFHYDTQALLCQMGNNEITFFYEDGKTRRAVCNINESSYYVHWTFYYGNGNTKVSFDQCVEELLTPNIYPAQHILAPDGSLCYNNVSLYDIAGKLVYEQKCSEPNKPINDKYEYECFCYLSSGRLSHKAVLLAAKSITEVRFTKLKADGTRADYEEFHQQGWLLETARIGSRMNVDKRLYDLHARFLLALDFKNTNMQMCACAQFYLGSMMQD
jgi:hypothetical protein